MDVRSVGQLRLGVVGCEVEQRQLQLHPADAVGDRVVDFENQRGGAVGQTVDDGGLPQWPCPIEALHADRLGHRQHVGQGRSLGHGDEAQVVGEVEVRVELPAGRGDRQGVGPHALAEPGDHTAEVVDLVAHPIVVQSTLERADGDDR